MESITDGFEWDRSKAAANVRKHGVSFFEASTAFNDLNHLTTFDPEHSNAEDRFVLLGFSFLSNLLMVVHAERGDNIRIISARHANAQEATNYAKNLYDRQR